MGAFPLSPISRHIWWSPLLEVHNWRKVNYFDASLDLPVHASHAQLCDRYSQFSCVLMCAETPWAIMRLSSDNKKTCVLRYQNTGTVVFQGLWMLVSTWRTSSGRQTHVVSVTKKRCMITKGPHHQKRDFRYCDIRYHHISLLSFPSPTIRSLELSFEISIQ